jgi:hypothetical protein
MARKYYKPQYTNQTMKLRGNIFLKNKKGQETMSLPFGLIFSIILIVVFLVIAFIAVRYFLDLADCTGVGQFYDNFQSKIDEAWNTGTSSFKFKTGLPSNLDKICIYNYTGEITNKIDGKEITNKEPEATVYLLPQGNSCGMYFKEIKHLDIGKLTQSQNPRCFNASSLIIKKDFYDKFVSIEQ